jgi:hypothetical protein
VNLGEPQRFGTQSTAAHDGVFKMSPVDPAVTDEQRACWNVPAQADRLRRIAAMNAMNAARR